MILGIVARHKRVFAIMMLITLQRPIGSAAISCPILSLNSSRIGYETIGFKMNDRDMSLRVSGKIVGELEVNGVSGYCVFLELKKGNDYFIVDKYWVEHCPK